MSALPALALSIPLIFPIGYAVGIGLEERAFLSEVEAWYVRVSSQPYHFTQSLLSAPTNGPGRCRDNTYKYTETEERLAKSCGKSVVRRHPIVAEQQ